jgi:hypothetical protein
LKTGLSETLNIVEDRPPKRRRLRVISIDEDDMNWLKGEISDIKVSIGEIVEHLKEDMDYKLEDILDEIKQLS